MMGDDQVYSDSNNCGFSQDLEDNSKKNNSNSTLNKLNQIQKSAHYLSQSLLKQSDIEGIPTLKNKYISKIKTISTQLEVKNIKNKTQLQQILVKKQPSICSSYINKDDDGSSSINQPQFTNKTSSIMDKKQRNKQSAKLSRDRKKLYIQMLEQKQKALNKKLLSKKKELEQTKNYLDRVINQNKAMSGFTASRHQMIKKLESVLQNKQLRPQQKDRHINQIIDNLRYKIGAAGKERINTINQYFRQIVNLSLPALHRYMMWSATEETHLFSPNDQQTNDEWYKQLKTSLNLTQEQKKQVQTKKAFLQQQKKILEKLISKLKSIKSEIQEKSLQLEELIDQVRLILTPIQCAHFVLFIEKNKYRKQLNLCDQLQDQNKRKNSDEKDDQPRKMIKTQKASQNSYEE